MDNKGFTLIELMAVITIIAILAILITPGILSIRESVLESSYINKLSQIENAAKEYGTEHITELISPVSSDYVALDKSPNENCIYRTINFLINNGYLKVTNSNAVSGTNNYTLTDPRDGSSMNNMRICIRFDNNIAKYREVVAYLVEE